MSTVNIPRPDPKDLAGDSALQNYLDRVFKELEHVLSNLDEENMTELYRKEHPSQK